jgi:hypothetical protein
MHQLCVGGTQPHLQGDQGHMSEPVNMSRLLQMRDERLRPIFMLAALETQLLRGV